MGYLDPPEPDPSGEMCAETQVELGLIHPWEGEQELSVEAGDCWRCPIRHRCQVGRYFARAKLEEFLFWREEVELAKQLAYERETDWRE